GLKRVLRSAGVIADLHIGKLNICSPTTGRLSGNSSNSFWTLASQSSHISSLSMLETATLIPLSESVPAWHFQSSTGKSRSSSWWNNRKIPLLPRYPSEQMNRYCRGGLIFRQQQLQPRNDSVVLAEDTGSQQVHL